MRSLAFALSLLLLSAPLFAQGKTTQKRIQTVQEKIAKIGEAKTDEDKAKKKALEDQVKVLQELAALEETSAKLPSEEALKSEQDSLQAEIQALRAKGPEPIPENLEKAAPYESAADNLKAQGETQKSLLKQLAGKKAGLEKESATLPGKIADQQQKIATLQDSHEPLADIQLETAKIRLQLLQAQQNYDKTAADRLALQIPVEQAKAELLQVQLDRALHTLATAREAISKNLKKQAEAARAEAERKNKASNGTTDPVARLRNELDAEIARQKADWTEDKAAKEDLSAQATHQESAIQRLTGEMQRLQSRFASHGAVSGSVAELLLSTQSRIRDTRRNLRSKALPALDQQLQFYQDRRAKVQDRSWQIETPESAKTDASYKRALAKVAPDRQAALDQVFNEEVGKLKDVLGKRQVTLDAIDVSLSKLEKSYEQRIQLIGEIDAFIQSRIYWVKNEPALGVSTVTGAAKELPKIVSVYTGAESLSGVARAFRERTSLFLLSCAGMVALIFLGFFVTRKIRSFRSLWHYRGGAFLAGVQRILMAVALSAVAPLCFLAAAQLLGVPDLPAPVATTLQEFLRGFAVLWFLRRFLWRLFRTEGIGVVNFGMPAPIAEQILKASNRLTAAGILLYLPYSILKSEPFALVDLPRLLYTAILVVVSFIAVRLFRRKGALVSSWTHRSGFLYRVWPLLDVTLALVLAGIVAMDAAGYRVGSEIFLTNVVQTLGAVLLLAGLYALSHRLVDRVASRIRVARAHEEGAAAAYEISNTVMGQLSRVVSLALIAVAVVLLAKFWGFYDGVRGALDSVVLLHVGSGAVLTLWNVLKAALFIAAAHFLVRNLSGIYEFFFFPLLGETDTGGRFVAIALSRYAILLVAYGAALLTLHFSFSSIGWLLAAASVGLGFGLQEIVANFVSGLILLIERPIRVGDIVTVGDTGGTVERINIRATVVIDFDRKTVIVPNKNFITDNLINWTRNDRLMRRKVVVGVAYGSDVEKVARVLKEIVESHPKVLKDPPPRVLFLEFGDSSLNLEVWFFTLVHEGWDVLNDLNNAVNKRFAAEGIEIPFPQRDLHVRSVDDSVGLRAIAEQEGRGGKKAASGKSGDGKAG